MIIKEVKKINNNIYKIKENKIKKIKSNTIENNIIINKYLIINFIKIIILDIFLKIKSNILFDLFHFKFSKITLKIKGIGDSIIFGNEKGYKFTGINYLKEIYINDYKQNTIKYIYYFNQTDNFVSLIWDDNINNCAYMFRKCSNITEINLSNFNTSQVTSTNNMFTYCSSLTSLNLSNFDTSQVRNMNCMFYSCSSLTSLNLSNFDTSQVSNMNCMFYDCSSLTSLNLSNFNTSQVTSLSSMFKGCDNLEYINMKIFDELKLDNSSYHTMFSKVPENIVICINETITQSKIFLQIKNKKCYVIDCTDSWRAKQKKIMNINNECIESCNKLSLYQYEYNGKCYENCSNGFLYDNNKKANKCKCELDKCLSCPKIALKKGLCNKCNTNYYPKENDPLNLGEYINCYKEPEGYYLYKNLYKQCYYTCKKCKKPGNNKNHNCIECNANYPTENKYNNYINCYENCRYYHYIDVEYNYHCTKDLSCPNDYPELVADNKECIKNSIKNIIKDLIINEKNVTEKMSKEDKIEFYDNLIQKIENGFTDNYDTPKLDNGQEEYIKADKIIVTFTTSQNQKRNINKTNNNMTRIDLGDCETLLRDEYNISSNEILYMKKIDIDQEGMKIPKVEYDVYCKLFGTNLIKLNLTVCEKSKVSIFIPIVITEDLDKFNSSSEYYQDICYSTTSEDGTDISLKDRKKEFIENNKMVCQEDCDFSEYNYNTYTAECLCKVKESSQSFSEMNIDKIKLLFRIY